MTIKRCLFGMSREVGAPWPPRSPWLSVSARAIPRGKRRRDARQRGVALLIIVGLLAVLTLAAVAFSVAMRVERKGASHFRDTIQARQMLWSALCAAVEEINRTMTTNAVLPYPPWDVLASPGSGDWPGRAPVMSRGLAPFVQPGLLKRVQDARPHWTAIDVGGQVRGRYAYIALNTSGLLDANQVGGTNRLGGASPRELVLTNTVLADFVGAKAVEEFLSARSDDLRYETLGELLALNEGTLTNCSNFDVFSLSREDQLWLHDRATNRVYVGTNIALWNAEQIMSAFEACGVPRTACGLAYSNLLDYVDPDSVPRSLASGCTEPIPMINEVLMPMGWFQFSATSFVERIGLAIECLYPFVTPMTNTFTLGYDIRFLNNGGGPEYVPTDVITNRVPMAPGGLPYRVIPVSPPILRSGTILTTNKVDFWIQVSAYIEDEQGKRVDEVPSPWNPPVNAVRLRVQTPVLPGTTTNVIAWAECADPRFNWRPEAGGADRHWYRSDEIAGPFGVTNGTPGTTNHTTLRLYFNTTNTVFDRDIFMHVANRPLQSVGELGSIAYDRWKTIRLYAQYLVPELRAPTNAPPGEVLFHRVLDYFTLFPTNSPFARGRVNVNTSNEHVLASVFVGLPEAEYSAATSPRLNEAAARNVARDILNAVRTAGNFWRLSDLGTVTNIVRWVSGKREIDRESILRNSCELLTARHNLFTIFLLADSFSADIGGQLETGSTLASARGVAQVWRDPLPVVDKAGRPITDASGRRVFRWFVRFFQHVDE